PGAVRRGTRLRAASPPVGGQQPLPQGARGRRDAAIRAVSRRSPGRVHRVDRPPVLHCYPGPPGAAEPTRRPPSALQRADRGGDPAPRRPPGSDRRTGRTSVTDGPGLDSQIAASTVLGAGSFLTLERAVVKLSTGEEL